MHAAAELAAAMRTAQPGWPGTHGARATSSGSTILNMHDARHAVGFVNMLPGTVFVSRRRPGRRLVDC